MGATSASYAVVEQFAREVLGDLLVDAARQAVWTPLFLPDSLHGEWQVCIVAAGVMGAVVSARCVRRTRLSSSAVAFTSALVESTSITTPSASRHNEIAILNEANCRECSVSLADLQDLRDRINITWEYLRRHMAGSDVVPQMDAVVERVTAGKSLRQLRMIAADLRDWATGLPPEQLNELQSLLAGRFGPDAALDDEDATRRERIVKRGHIRTADEYRLITARVEAIYADATHREELETLNGLLAEAHARAGRLPGD